MSSVQKFPWVIFFGTARFFVLNYQNILSVPLSVKEEREVPLSVKEER